VIMVRFFYALAVFLLCGVLPAAVFAGTTSAVLTGSTVVNFTTADSSCAALKTAFALTAGRVLHSCSADPVTVGTTLLFTNTATNPRTVAFTTVTQQTSAAPATAYPVTAYPDFMSASRAYTGAAITAAVASVPTGGGTPATLTATVTDSFGTATPEQYAAMGTVFGAILTAAVLIWAGKRVYVFFNPQHEA